MSNPVQDALGAFEQDALTCKLLRGVYKVVPYSPEFPHYVSVDDAVRALKPDATQDVFVRARDIAANAQDLQDVLWMANLVDAGDKGYSVLTGLVSAWRLYQGEDDALETDAQQRNDAILKALAISYMVYNAFDGSMAERAKAFRTTPSGKALGIYYASIEVALPFADNAALGTGNLLHDLYTGEGGAGAQMARLKGMASGKSLEGATEMLSTLTSPLQRVVDHAKNYIAPVSEAVKPYVPGAMNAADKGAGIIANAADVMPVYRLLGARLAAEGAAIRAIG